MVNKEHLAILNQGVEVWNQWRKNNPEIIPELSGAYISELNLSRANFIGAILHGASLYKANLSYAQLNTAFLHDSRLNEANLAGADLSGADLCKANLTKANLTGANLSEAQLNQINFKDACLLQTNLIKANLSNANFSKAYLVGSNFYKAKLIEADFSFANLVEAKLNDADLSRVDFRRCQVLGTNFEKAILTGACLEDWHFSRGTNFNNVECEYVYLRNGKRERRPSSGEFAPGEFTKLFQKALETVDLIFADGIDWKAFILSFQELQAEYGKENLLVQAIERKSGGAFVIRLEVPPGANKADIESQTKALYEIQLKALEARYHAELQAKDEQIIIYRQHNATLENVISILGNRPIQNIITVTANAENNSVSETFNNNFNQPNIANFANKNQDDARQQANQNIYQSQQNQNLDGTKKEIQQLLNQLAQTNLTTDAVTEAVHQKIKTDPTFKARLLAALKAGGLEALKAIFNHPAFSIPVETIKGFLEAE